MERLKKQMEFILEVDKLKKIMRQTYLSDESRKENDAEHSWHLALMACILKEYSNEDIKLDKTIFMVLIHDLVEIDAGDTYAYDEKGYETKRQREELAAERVFGLLPEDQAKELRDLWEEFEECKTPEAKFANTLDKIQPLMLNDATDGRAWREHEVAVSKVLKRNEYTKDGSDDLWNYAYELIMNNVKKHNLMDDVT